MPPIPQFAEGFTIQGLLGAQISIYKNLLNQLTNFDAAVPIQTLVVRVTEETNSALKTMFIEHLQRVLAERLALDPVVVENYKNLLVQCIVADCNDIPLLNFAIASCEFNNRLYSPTYFQNIKYLGELNLRLAKIYMTNLSVDSALTFYEAAYQHFHALQDTESIQRLLKSIQTLKTTALSQGFLSLITRSLDYLREIEKIREVISQKKLDAQRMQARLKTAMKEAALKVEFAKIAEIPIDIERYSTVDSWRDALATLMSLGFNTKVTAHRYQAAWKIDTLLMKGFIRYGSQISLAEKALNHELSSIIILMNQRLNQHWLRKTIYRENESINLFLAVKVILLTLNIEKAASRCNLSQDEINAALKKAQAYLAKSHHPDARLYLRLIDRLKYEVVYYPDEFILEELQKSMVEGEDIQEMTALLMNIKLARSILYESSHESLTTHALLRAWMPMDLARWVQTEQQKPAFSTAFIFQKLPETTIQEDVMPEASAPLLEYVLPPQNELPAVEHNVEISSERSESNHKSQLI